MAKLANHRHELFAQALAKGMNQTAAYEEAGYKRDETAASRLSRNVKVRERLTELQERGAVRAEITVADLVAELEEARRIALSAATPQSGAAVAASLGKGKLLGLIVEKSEAKVTLSHEDALDALR